MLTDPNAVMYVVYGKTKEHQYYPWNAVSRSEYVRHDGVGFSGTAEEIQHQISDYEELPISMIRPNGHRGFELCCMERGHLQLLLQWTKCTERGISVHAYSTKAQLAADAGLKVRGAGYGSWVIGEQWTLMHSTLLYDPEKAAEAIAKEPAPVEKGPRKPSTKCRITWKDGFSPICRSLRGALDGLRWFNHVYPGRSWRRRFILDLRTPSFKAEALEHISTLAELYFALAKNRLYRTAEFMAAVKLIAKKHLKDPQMTPEFKEFILKESRARVRASKKETVKV